MIDRELDSALRALRCHDADPQVVDRIHRRALAVLRLEREELRQPWRSRAKRAWAILEPAFSTGVVGSYLAWMVWTVARVGH